MRQHRKASGGWMHARSTGECVDMAASQRDRCTHSTSLMKKFSSGSNKQLTLPMSGHKKAGKEVPVGENPRKVNNSPEKGVPRWPVYQVTKVREWLLEQRARGFLQQNTRLILTAGYQGDHYIPNLHQCAVPWPWRLPTTQQAPTHVIPLVPWYIKGIWQNYTHETQVIEAYSYAL